MNRFSLGKIDCVITESRFLCRPHPLRRRNAPPALPKGEPLAVQKAPINRLTALFSFLDRLLPITPSYRRKIYKNKVDKIMREIQIADHKTLKLTNVLSRKIQPEEFANLQVVLTQMVNFIKSNNAQPIGPMIQCVKMSTGPNPQAEVYFLQQTTQLIPRMDPGYQMDAVLRVRNCLYAHYTGPMSRSSLASQKLDIYAFENEIELTGSVYTIFVNQDEDEGIVDVFMETK